MPGGARRAAGRSRPEPRSGERGRDATRTIAEGQPPPTRDRPRLLLGLARGIGSPRRRGRRSAAPSDKRRRRGAWQVLRASVADRSDVRLRSRPREHALSMPDGGRPGGRGVAPPPTLGRGGDQRSHWELPVALAIGSFSSGLPPTIEPGDGLAALRRAGGRVRPSSRGSGKRGVAHSTRGPWRREAQARTVLGDFANASFTNGRRDVDVLPEGRQLVRPDGRPDGSARRLSRSAYTFGVVPAPAVPRSLFADGRHAGAVDRLGRAAARGGRTALVPSLSDEHVDPSRRAPLDAPPAELELRVRRLPLDEPAAELRRRARPLRRRRWSDLDGRLRGLPRPRVRLTSPGRRNGRGTERMAHRRAQRSRSTSGRAALWIPDADGNAARKRAARVASRGRDLRAAATRAEDRFGRDPGPTGRLLDTHAPALPEAALYEPDGQQHAEV